MQGPRPEAVNTRPAPRPMFTIDPTKATKQLQDFTVPVGSMFIADVVEEHARVLQEAERRMRREEMLLEDDSSAAFDADKFAADGPQVRFSFSSSRHHQRSPSSQQLSSLRILLATPPRSGNTSNRTLYTRP